jgi:cytochrome c
MVQPADMIRAWLARKHGPALPFANREDRMTRKILIPSALVAAVLAGGASLQPLRAAARGPNGETFFRQRCQSCHTVTQGRPSTLGPSLIGVVGRKAASAQFNYSPALKDSGLTWNRATLDRFLAAPTRTVPGTRMVIAVPDPAQRAALIGYLETRK